jgi:glycosyltransferase involved in cell wall biosynthesis
MGQWLHTGLTIGFITNVYARASDTFIRREVRQLRRIGHIVYTFSVRKVTEDRLISEEIRQEQERTDYILTHGPPRLVWSFLKLSFSRPGRMLATIALAWRTCAPGMKASIWQLAYLLEAAYLAERVKRLGIQHIHVHKAAGVATVVMFATSLTGIPYSMTVHGPAIFFEPGRWALAEKIHRSSFTACISAFCRSQCMAWTPTSDWERLEIIRCGVDASFLGQPPTPVPDVTSLICVGRYCEMKAQVLLIEAVAKLRDRGVDFRLNLVGDGPLRDRLQELIRRYDLAGQVQLLGWRSSEEIRRLILESRAMVLPSFAEGLPVVFMEAFALGRPVITTWVAGHPELVSPGENGWLVPAGAVEPLVEAMREALTTDVDRLTEMGRHGARLVADLHSVETEVARLSRYIGQSVERNCSQGSG